MQPFLHGDRKRDRNNWGPRIGFNWANRRARHERARRLRDLLRPHDARDRVARAGARRPRAADRGARGQRVLPRSRDRHRCRRSRRRFANPFTGFILPGAGASGINIIDNTLAEPDRAAVQPRHRSVSCRRTSVLRVDGVHNLGTHFIIGRPIGVVYNPVVGGPDRVVNLESSVNTQLRRAARQRSSGAAGAASGCGCPTRWRKALNYANDDQIPFSNGPIDPNDLRARVRPDPERPAASLRAGRARSCAPRVCGCRRHLDARVGVPMDILMPDGASPRADAPAQRGRPAVQDRGRAQRVPHRAERERRGRRRAAAARERRRALQRQLRRRSTCGCRAASRSSSSFSLEAIVECFNVFNVTNILGVIAQNYSGYANVLVRDSSDPADPGFLRSSSLRPAPSRPPAASSARAGRVPSSSAVRAQF